MDSLQILAEKMPEVLDFAKDFSSLEPATKVLSFHISCAVYACISKKKIKLCLFS